MVQIYLPTFTAAVEDYLAAGFRLFKCNDFDPDRSEKAPARKGWRDTPYEPLLDPVRLQPIYGLCLQDDDLVLDVDPRRFVNGVNQLKRLWSQLNLPPLSAAAPSSNDGGGYASAAPTLSAGTVIENPGNGLKSGRATALQPATVLDSTYIVRSASSDGCGEAAAVATVLDSTYIVRSASGGLHVYFKKPADYPVRRRLDGLGFGAIEVKSLGQLVLGAGSTLADGRSYKIECGTPRLILPAPIALLEFIKRPEGFPDPLQGEGIVIDDEATRNRFIRFLMREETPLRGSFQISCEGRDFGLPPERVLELMQTYYNHRRPDGIPKTEAQLKQKIANAANHTQNEKPGAKHPQSDFADIIALRGEDPVVAEQLAKLKWDLTAAGALLPTLHNAVNFFVIPPHKRQGAEDYENPLYRLIRYNLFAEQIEFTRPAPWHTDHTNNGAGNGTNNGAGNSMSNGTNNNDKFCRHWTDADTVLFELHLSKNKHYNATGLMCYKAVVAAAHMEQYHPVKGYLNGLVWDGTERLDTFLITHAGAADKRYTRAVGANLLKAAVARVMQPGCQCDNIVVLEGRQGSGKTTFVRTLGGPWFADIHIDPHNKDTIQCMMGSWFIEASEMEFMKRAEVQALKAFLTRPTDRIRLAYGRLSQEIPRQSVFVGTINNSANGYLRDRTGNRRYLPVLTTAIDIPALRRDRDQLFAEAVHRYRAGEAWHITDSVIEAMAVEEQEKRIDEDVWNEIISSWLHNQSKKRWSTEDIANLALDIPKSKIDWTVKTRLFEAIRAAGWRRIKRWVKERNRQERFWEPEDETGQLVFVDDDNGDSDL